MKKYFKFLIPLFIIINLTTNAGYASMQVPNENKEATQEVDRLQKIKESGVLTVLSPNIEPQSYRNPRTGAFSGFDAEIIKEIAKRLGAEKVNVKYISFSNALEELVKNPDIDLLAQAIYITDERKNLVNFTNPIYTENDVILTSKNSGISDKEDLKGAVVGVNGGSVYVPIVDNWKKQGMIKDYIIFFDNNSLIIALENRTIDVVLTDSMIAENILLSKPKSDFKLLSPSQYKSEIHANEGYPLKKEDITLLGAINDKLQEMKNDGTLYEILARYGLAGHYIQ